MSSSSSSLPRNAKEVFRLSRTDRILYEGVIALQRWTGGWQYPMRTCGDLEQMTTLDKIYWLYKAAYPIRRARKDSGLEAFFSDHSWPGWTPPEGFRVVGEEVTLSAVGDLMDHPFLAEAGEHLYRDVDDLIFGADLSMGNLECSVVSSGAKLSFSATSGPSLWFAPRAFDVVTTSGSKRFSFLATACNHSLDFGIQGVESTLKFLRAAGIEFHGANASEDDATRCRIIERRGIRIAVIAWTFGLNARRPPTPWAINRTNLNDAPNLLDANGIARQIESAHAAGVDLVVAHLHWGLEHELYPTPEQRGVAHRLAEIGVDVVVGHHPHVLQPVEYYKPRRDPDRIVPIYYSLGNLTNPFSAHHLCRSGVARVTVVKGLRSDGRSATYVKRADVVEVDQVADEQARKLRVCRAGDRWQPA